MPMSILNHKTIGDINHGFSGAAIDEEIRKAFADLENRGEEDGKARVVEIKLSMMKIKGGAIALDVQAVAKIPAYRTGITVAEPGIDALAPRGRQHVIQFRSDNPENPRQQTFADGEIPNEE
jgi:hypothetical protein